MNIENLTTCIEELNHAIHNSTVEYVNETLWIVTFDDSKKIGMEFHTEDEVLVLSFRLNINNDFNEASLYRILLLCNSLWSESHGCYFGAAEKPGTVSLTSSINITKCDTAEMVNFIEYFIKNTREKEEYINDLLLNNNTFSQDVAESTINNFIKV